MTMPPSSKKSSDENRLRWNVLHLVAEIDLRDDRLYYKLLLLSFYSENPIVCVEREAARKTEVTTNKKAELSKDDHAMRPIYGCPVKFRES